MPDRLVYGPLPDQYAVRHTHDPGAPVAAVIHGGFWRARYTQEIMDEFCDELAELGWTAWSVEYRRVGAGGGYPETLDDVRAACAALEPELVVGHSAGGHLALWAAAERLAPRAVSLAGVCDLVAGARDGIGRGAVSEFMNGSDDYAYADPMQRLPIDAHITVVHGSEDDTVPLSQSRAFAAASGCVLVELEGAGHFDVIDPQSPHWPAVRATLEP